jgi:hypothetical protein
MHGCKKGVGAMFKDLGLALWSSDEDGERLLSNVRRLQR